MGGPRGGRTGLTAGRSRSEAGGPEPSSDRLLAGPGELGLGVGEHHADQLRPPGRMVATRGEDRLADRVGMGMIEWRGGVITGKEAGGAPLAIPLQEMTDGARREVVGLGQGGRGFPPSRSLPEFLTDRNGDGLGHRGRLRVGAVKVKDDHPFQHATRPLAKPRERINPAKPTER